MDSKKVYTKHKSVTRIVPKNWKKTPVDCPVCGFAFRDFDDVLNYKTHSCCKDCDLVYRQPNSKKWEKGWRPDKP